MYEIGEYQIKLTLKFAEAVNNASKNPLNHCFISDLQSQGNLYFPIKITSCKKAFSMIQISYDMVHLNA